MEMSRSIHQATQLAEDKSQVEQRGTLTATAAAGARGHRHCRQAFKSSKSSQVTVLRNNSTFKSF